MTFSTLRAAELSQAVYTPPYTWQIADVCANYVTEGSDTAVVVQGTEDVLEVLRDAEFVTTHYPGLGPLHTGALHAALALYPLVRRVQPSAVIGHSLGGMVAIILAGLLCEYGAAPEQLIALEPAMVTTGDDLAASLRFVKYPPVLTRAGNDPIPTWPDIPSIGQPVWRHPAPLFRFGVNKLLPLDAHKIANVIGDLKLSNVVPI